MFLRLGRSNLFTKLSIALGLMTGVACGQPAFPCYVDLPVYSGAGVRLPFRIVAAEADGDSASLRISARLQIPRLEYQKDVLTLGKVLVTLEDEKRKRLRTNVEIVACIQQTSLVYGQIDTEMDVPEASIVGRIRGCPITDSWWVRVMPTFGGQTRRSIYEGVVGSDGRFEVIANMRGERHIIVVGRGVEPLAVIGAQVTSGGGRTDIGVVDVRAGCRSK